MPGAARASVDVAGGILVKGSTNVLINGKLAVRRGDLVANHGPGTHRGPVMAQGSPNVIVNGRPLCRQGDVAACSHSTTGSPNVIVN